MQDELKKIQKSNQENEKVNTPQSNYSEPSTHMSNQTDDGLDSLTHKGRKKQERQKGQPIPRHQQHGQKHKHGQTYSEITHADNCQSRPPHLYRIGACFVKGMGAT